MIEAVTFDFWATLYRDPFDQERTRLRAERWAEFLDRQGHPMPTDNILAAFRQTSRRFEEVWLGEQRSFPTAEATDYALDRLELALPEEDRRTLTRIMEETVLDTPPLLVEGVREVLHTLHREYRIGLVSDTGYSPGRSLRQIMARDRVLGYFEAMAFSDETGKAKPQPIQFLTTLEAMEAAPERSVHIGDLIETDIKGAKGIGMKAVLFIGVNDRSTDRSLADAVISDLREIPALLAQW